MNAAPTFGQWVKQRRQALDLTQEGLAEALGCALDTVRKIEAGRRRPSRQIVELLAVHLAVAPEDRPALVEWARGTLAAPPALAAPAALPPRRRPGAPLPIPSTPLVGRAAEIAAVRGLLWRAPTRLVTLTGPPGVGKTRLALAVAATLEDDFADGLGYVALAALGDPALLGGTIARALGVAVAPAQSPLAVLQEHLAEQALLLVLDNFEHLVAAAPLLAELLAAAPRLKVLSTSRSPLRLRGEKAVAVPPLPLPDPAAPLAPDALAAVGAVALFVERVQDGQSDFALTAANAATVVAICRRLDGLPLALELAAARTRLLSLPDLLTRLEQRLALLTGGPRDLPARQQTLRGAIQASYDLLSPAQARLFRRLSVFVAPWTLEAAEAVAGATLTDLGALLDSSLLRREDGAGAAETRYAMLATVREFGVEELSARGERASAQRGHASYYVALAERAAAELRGPAAPTWFARLSAAHDDLRAALEWVLEHGEPETALRLAAALGWFWYVQGYVSEGRRRLEQALAGSASAAPGLRARALHFAGLLAWAASDLPAAERRLEESLAYRRASGAPGEIAETLNLLGLVARERGAQATALGLFRESLALRRTLSNPLAVTGPLVNIAMILYEQRDYAEARALLDESLTLARQAGDPRAMGLALTNLAAVSSAAGDYAASLRYAEEGLALHRATGDRSSVAYTLGNLGQTARRLGDVAGARAYLTEAVALFAATPDRVRLAECLEEFAALAGAEGAPQQAARLYGAAAALRAAAGVPAAPPEAADYAPQRDAARAQLPPAAWESAWRAGYALSLEQALALAQAGDGRPAAE